MPSAVWDGMMEAYGVRGNYQDGISNEYYFDGLLVAMNYGYRPVGIIVMSFFFAFLKVGAAGMELNAGVRENCTASSSRWSFSSWPPRAA